MYNTGLSAWKVTPEQLTLHLATPGLDGVHVSQKGRELRVSGENRNYGVHYSYTVQLHPDARDNVRYQYHQGLVVVTCDNVNSVDVVLGVNANAGCVPVANPLPQ